MHSFLSIFCIIPFEYMCLLHNMIAPVHHGTANHARGFITLLSGVRSPYTFTSAAPRTYSTICIGSESRFGSIVGFAWLLCFGALRSAISAKVALGEPLRLCPSSAGLSTSVEKAKTDCHDEARDRSLFERFFESLKTYATSSEELALSGQRRG